MHQCSLYIYYYPSHCIIYCVPWFPIILSYLPCPSLHYIRPKILSYPTIMERLNSAGCSSVLSDDELENNSWFPFCVTATTLSSYSGILLSLLFIFYVFLNRFVFRRFLLVYMYGKHYSSLEPSGQRMFCLRHIGVLARTISLVLIIKPAVMLALFNSRWTDSYFRNSSITLGDMAFLSASFTSAFHIFELIFDEQLKPLLLAHHLGAIVLVQAFLPTAASLPATRVIELNRTIAMANICLCWGECNFLY